MMSQWWVKRSSNALVILASTKTHGYSLIVFPLAKCSRRTRPIVSTITIPTTRSQPEQADCQCCTRGGQFWTPIPRIRGSNLHAKSHICRISVNKHRRVIPPVSGGSITYRVNRRRDPALINSQRAAMHPLLRISSLIQLRRQLLARAATILGAARA
jgi:hypothetical protein